MNGRIFSRVQGRKSKCFLAYPDPRVPITETLIETEHRRGRRCHTVLVFAGEDPTVRHDVDTKMVDKINWIVMASAHHFVFAQTDAKIQKMAHELIGSCIFGKTAFVPRGPLPTAKDFLIKFLGLKVKN